MAVFPFFKQSFGHFDRKLKKKMLESPDLFSAINISFRHRALKPLSAFFWILAILDIGTDFETLRKRKQISSKQSD